MKLEIRFDDQAVQLQLPENKTVPSGLPEPARPPADAAQLLREALDHPSEFPPLNRAITPDDHIAVVLDLGLPHIDRLLAVLMEYLGAAGVQKETVTLVIASEPKAAGWRERLGLSQSGLAVEIHDPSDRDKLSYLAATQKGRRVYINRTVVDADQVVVLARAGYDWVQGYTGATTSIFPALSDEATRTEFSNLTEALAQGESIQTLLRESEEAIWLLGAPFFIQVIEGFGDDIAQIVAGSHESLVEGRSRLNAVWKPSGQQRATLVVADLTGSPVRLDLNDLAGAAAKAAQWAEPEGIVAIVFPAVVELDEAMQVVSSASDAMDAARQLHRHKSQSPGPALQWLSALGRARLYLLSPTPGEIVEEIFATPLEKPGQIQKLIDAAPSVLLLRDPHKLVAGPALASSNKGQRPSRSRGQDRARRSKT